MDEETKARFDTMDARFDSLMVRMNDGFERVLDWLEMVSADFRNTKTFVIEDALVLVRRLKAVEHRLDELERKP